MGGLTRRAIKAGTSMAVMTGLENLTILARTLVLSRLLLPREFGLMGMAFIAINAVESLTMTGFYDALVQRRDDPRPFFDTVFTFQALRGVGLAAVLMLIAPGVGAFFSNPEVVPVLQVISAITVTRGLSSPAWCLRERELRMTLFYMPRLLCVVADFGVTAVFAWRQPTVWAMVYGFLAGTVVQLVMSYVVAPYWPRLRLDMTQLGELRIFGKHIFRQQLLGTIIDQVDRLVVGRLRDVTQLGFYTFATRLVTIPSQVVLTMGVRVVFPTFARIQTEPERVRAGFLRLMGLMALISFPMSVGMLATAPEMIPALFGPQWIPLTLAFQILSLVCAARTLEYTCAFAGGGIGRPDLAVHATVVKLVILGAGIIPATLWLGIEGAATVVVVAAIVTTLFLVHRVTRLVGAAFRPYAGLLGVPAASCLLMVAAVGAARAVAPPLPGPAILALLVATGVITYTLGVALIDRVSQAGIVSMVMEIIRRR